MTTHVGNRSRWQIVASFILLLGVELGTALALRPGQEFRPRVDGRRRAELLQMGFLEQMYSESDWSTFRDAIARDPGGDDNAELMLIPVSLGNVYLNDYELRRSRSDFERGFGAIEWVAVNDQLWGGRRASGTVVAYLELSLTRLADECDVGSAAGRVAALKDRVDEILSREAAGRLMNGVSDSEASEAAADSAALFGAAASFLPDASSTSWEAEGRLAAARAIAECPTDAALLSLSEGALAFSLTGRLIPGEYQQIPILSPANQPRTVCVGSAARRPPMHLMTIVPADDLEERLSGAIFNSRIVAMTLTGSFLWKYPPGSVCVENPFVSGERFDR
jgi:hypothetical protein